MSNSSSTTLDKTTMKKTIMDITAASTDADAALQTVIDTLKEVGPFVAGLLTAHTATVTTKNEALRAAERAAAFTLKEADSCITAKKVTDLALVELSKKSMPAYQNLDEFTEAFNALLGGFTASIASSKAATDAIVAAIEACKHYADLLSVDLQI